MEIIVANVCAGCGAALTPDMQSCSSCGAALVAQPIIAPPAKSGGGTLKIILIVVGIIVALGILGIGVIGFIGYRIAKSAHVDANGRVTMNTPMGAIATTPVENISAAELGVEIYPGAESTRGSLRMEMPNGSGVTGAFLTSDSPAQVLAFYKDKLGSNANVTSLFGNTSLRLKISRMEYVEVRINTFSNLDKGKTRILISHTTLTKAP
jgi:hypothetical protein